MMREATDHADNALTSAGNPTAAPPAGVHWSMSPQRWVLRHEARPWGTNAERRLNPYERAALVKTWREAFAWLARAQRVPHLELVALTVVPHLRNRRSMPDTASCAPAAKAALDGLVDARVLDDDGPSIVRSILFVAPIVSGVDALDLIVEEIKAEVA